jgi:hypothetical protein
MIQEEVYGASLSIILSPYQNFFGYSLGGYSHRERCHAPDKKIMDERKSKELWLHCQQNKHGLLPSGDIHESKKG